MSNIEHENVPHQGRGAARAILGDVAILSVILSPGLFLVGGFIYTAVNPSCEDGGHCSGKELDYFAVQNQLSRDFDGIQQLTLNSRTDRFSFSGYYKNDTEAETCVGSFKSSSAGSAADIIGPLSCNGSVSVVVTNSR